MVGEDPAANTPALYRVLIVEDDRATRRLLERMVRERGHQTVSCGSAEEALDLLGSEEFPLIVLDIQLPGMSGLDLSRDLRSRPEGAYYYILVGTSNNRPEDLREILSAGADDYIAKPYNPGLLDVRLTVAEANVNQIKRRKKLESELLFLARQDPLTGLSNRSQLEPALDQALALARNGKPGVLLYVDLDNFKIINDTLGHDCGDRLLVKVSETLRELTRDSDTLVRFGGDEFVMILPNCQLPEGQRIAERLRERLEEIVFIEEGRTFHVGGSIGVAPIDGVGSPGDLMGWADAACYAAKAHGRNRVELYRGESNELARLMADTDWAQRIREAMRGDAIQLWFQPVVSIETRKMVFQEVLLRFTPPDHTTHVNPHVFLSAVRRAGQITRLDRFVIARAFETLATDPNLTLSVNISGSLFDDETYCEFVESMLESSHISPARVLFEITEDELIPNLQNASRAIRRLQTRGCRFCLDDFGSGFSSLSYLKNLPIDMIKIDGGFIKNLPRQPFHQAVLRAIADLARALGVTTVAEHVEKPEEFRMIEQIGLNMAQGHLLGTPRQNPYSPNEVDSLARDALPFSIGGDL